MGSVGKLKIHQNKIFKAEYLNIIFKYSISEKNRLFFFIVLWYVSRRIFGLKLFGEE